MSEENSNLREAMDRLNESNRILLEARMLPNNKPLSAEQTFTIIERFNAYISERGIKLAQVAREINYVESVISSWRGNVYKGDNDAVTRIVNDWMERDARRAEAAKPKDYVSTWVAECMRTVAHLADKHLKMAVIVAPSGTGKTKVLQTLTKEMRGVYIAADRGHATPRGFLLTLSRAVDGRLSGNINVLLSSIVEKLKGTRRIIFLDEAHYLTPVLSLIRSIYDQAGVPIVMAGTSDILPYVDDRTDGRGQFASRTLFCNILDSIVDVERGGGDKSEVRNLFSIEEVQAFFATRKIRLTREALMLAWSLACLPNYGTLRFVGDLAALARDMIKGDAAIDRSHLLMALQLCLGRPLARHVKTVAERHEEISQRVAG